jgi:hypothetical protein
MSFQVGSRVSFWDDAPTNDPSSSSIPHDTMGVTRRDSSSWSECSFVLLADIAVWDQLRSEKKKRFSTHSITWGLYSHTVARCLVFRFQTACIVCYSLHRSKRVPFLFYRRLWCLSSYVTRDDRLTCAFFRYGPFSRSFAIRQTCTSIRFPSGVACTHQMARTQNDSPRLSLMYVENMNSRLCPGRTWSGLGSYTM